jgi:hypothetical protein
LVSVKDERFKELNRRYKAVTGENLPMAMIPYPCPYDELENNIKACEEAGKDMLPEIYNWDLSGNTLY